MRNYSGEEIKVSFNRKTWSKVKKRSLKQSESKVTTKVGIIKEVEERHRTSSLAKNRVHFTN